MGATSKELVAALLPLTTHKRYRVRVAAIQAIRDTVHQVGDTVSPSGRALPALDQSMAQSVAALAAPTSLDGRG